jgi:hypothetical protein
MSPARQYSGTWHKQRLGKHLLALPGPAQMLRSPVKIAKASSSWLEGNDSALTGGR